MWAEDVRLTSTPDCAEGGDDGAGCEGLEKRVRGGSRGAQAGVVIMGCALGAREHGCAQPTYLKLQNATARRYVNLFQRFLRKMKAGDEAI